MRCLRPWAALRPIPYRSVFGVILNGTPRRPPRACFRARQPFEGQGPAGAAQEPQEPAGRPEGESIPGPTAAPQQPQGQQSLWTDLQAA